MERIAESSYFPPISRCLTGDAVLHSWTSCLETLEDSSHDPTNDTLLETFLCDPQSISLLSHPFEPFKDPTPATKSWLDSQIASLTASSNPSLGPIKDLIQTEFKADSEWLSTTFRIDHGAALRLVILGYQRRPRNSLANIGTRSSTTATNLTNTGNPYSSSQPHRASFGRSTLQSNEDTQSAHRELLAHLFYEERIGLLRCAVYLSEAGLRRSHPETRSRWVEKVGRTIINTHAKGAEYDKTGKHFLVECVDAILRRVGELEDGAPWQTGDKDSPFSSSSDWITYQLRQTMVIQDLIYVLVENTADLLPSSVVLSWFRCLADTSFFETTPTDISTIDQAFWHIRCHSSLISLSILKLDLSLNALFPKDPSNSQQAAHDAYFSDEPTTTELTEILTAATERSSKVASLAVFAWAIILQSMRDVVNAGMETTDIDLTLEESGERANLSSVSESGTSPGISYPSLESAQRKDAHSTQITQYASYSRCLDSVRQILPDRDIISELAASAVQVSRVYDEVSELAFEFCESHSVTTIGNYGLRMKVNLLKLISASLDYVEYLPEIIQACLICLQVRPESSDPTNPAEDLGLMMLHDPELRYKLLERARQRFPYELSPFLQLSTAVISVARDDSEILRSFIPSLSAARIFADRIPPEFTAYEMIDNGDDLGSVVLTEDLVILSPSSSSTRFSVPAQSKELKTSHREHLTALLIISSGSTGHVMSLAKPLMIAWNHDYSIFGYLGLLLQESTSNLDNDLATILEITTFIVTILKATISPPTVGPSETVIDPHSILEDFGDLIPGNTIALLLLQILDRCLESAAQEPTLVSQDMDDLISQCLQFCGILMELQPSTIWPLLADGFLFGSKLKPSGLLEVLVSRSTMMVDSSLVRCTVDLHQAMTRTVLGKLAPQKPSTCDSNRWVDRRGSLSRRKSCSTGLGNQVRSEVIFAATKMLIDLLTALGDFTRLDKLIVLRLEGQILEIFLQILTLTFGVGNGPNNPGPLQQSFGTSGRLLKKCYLAEEKVTHPANKLLDLIKRGHENVGFMTSNLADSQVDEALASGLKLSAFLVKLEKEQDNQVLNAKVGEALADLAALYTSSQMLRMPIARLIGNLYIWDDRNGNTPKSAFGMFAERDAADFVSLLSLFDQPRDDVDLRKSLWELFETLVGCQAQWFTTLLLKGSSASAEIRPSQGRRDQDQSCLRSVWSIAISKLLSGDCPIDEEVKILAFITSAVSERPWALRDFSKRTELKTALRKRLGHYLKELQEFRDTDQITALRHIHLIQACAQMFDLFAMDLHRSWQLGEKSGISALKSDFSEYHYDALSRTEYNPSLHANLKRNFESRFPGLSPRNFQRTSITQVELGQDFYYDTEVASRLLTFDPSWTAYNGFLDSFTRANLNFSAVQAQLYLNKSWLRLTTQLTNPSLDDDGILDMAVEMACRSLAAVSQNQPGEPVFQALRITQLHVTLANLQRLDQVKLSPIQANRLLSATWDALRDYLIPDVNRMDDYTSSHRLAMRSLIYALKIQVRRQDSTGDQRKLKEKRATLESDSPGLIGSQIIDQVILRAVKSTIIALHEDQPATLTEELALATVILQNAAKLQGLGQYYTEISMTAISEDVLRTLANLFSWSRQIKKDDFPLFGQYCSRLLLEFSRIPQLAEQMAIQGILGLLANASILGAIRQGTSAVQMPKLFSIWVDDILPILLNVLSSVGKPVAQEVASFLNQFQARLEGSKNLWRDPEKITRSQVKESHLLILLGKIFETFDCGKALALDLDVQELTSGMIFLLEGRKSGLKGRVVPTNEEELAMARTDGSGGMNKLETLVCNELLEMRVLALGSEGVREESVRRNTRGGSLRP